MVKMRPLAVRFSTVICAALRHAEGSVREACAYEDVGGRCGIGGAEAHREAVTLETAGEKLEGRAEPRRVPHRVVLVLKEAGVGERVKVKGARHKGGAPYRLVSGC